MRNFTILFLLLISLINSYAQNFTVKGVVVLQNSGRKPLEGISISSTGLKTVETKSDGTFKLDFGNKKEGDYILISLKETDYKILNPDDLLLKLNSNSEKPLRITLCKHKDFNHKREELDDICINIVSRRKNEIINQLKNENKATQDTLNKIETVFLKAKKIALEFSDFFSLINLDFQSDLFKEAMQLFEQRDIDSAIKILENAKLLDQLKQYKPQQKREYKEIDDKKNECLDALKFLAGMYSLMFDFQKSEILFEKIIENDDQKAENIFFIANLLIYQSKYNKALNLCKTILTSDCQNWRKGQIYCKIGEIYEHKGVVDSAIISYSQYKDIFKQLYQNDDIEFYKSNLSLSYSRLGSIYLKDAQLDKSIEFYELYNKYEKEFHEIYPNSESITLKLARSYLSLGISYFANGDNDEALRSFLSCANLEKVLQQTSATNIEYKTDLALSYSWLGDVYLRKKENEKALESCSISNKLYKELEKTDDKSSAMKKNLAVSYGKLADVYVSLGQYDKGLELHNQSLSLLKKLYELEPNDNIVEGNIGTAYSSLGFDCFSKKQYEKAMEFYKLSYYFSAKLYEKQPSDKETKNNIAINRTKIGETFKAMGKLDSALVYFVMSNKLRKELYQSSPKLEKFKSSLGSSFMKIGEVYLLKKEADKSLENYVAYNSITNELYESNKNDENYQNELGVSYLCLADAYFALEDYDKNIDLLKKATVWFGQISQNNKKTIPYTNLAYASNKLAYSYELQGDMVHARENYRFASKIYMDRFNQTGDSTYSKWANNNEKRISKLELNEFPTLSKISKLQKDRKASHDIKEKIKDITEIMALRQKLWVVSILTIPKKIYHCNKVLYISKTSSSTSG